MAEVEGLEVMKPELGTKPRVYYRNLWRYSSAFIAGSISIEEGGLVDCVEDATVTLIKDGNQVAKVKSDNYGEFKFDRLEEYSGQYTIDIATEGGKHLSIAAELSESVNLGEIRLPGDP